MKISKTLSISGLLLLTALGVTKLDRAFLRTEPESAPIAAESGTSSATAKAGKDARRNPVLKGTPATEELDGYAGYHTVKHGETLADIARKHDTTLQKILVLNPDIFIERTLRVGQRLKIASYRSLDTSLFSVIREDGQGEITLRFSTPVPIQALRDTLVCTPKTDFTFTPKETKKTTSDTVPAAVTTDADTANTHASEFTLVGNFTPGTPYGISVTKDLIIPATNGTHSLRWPRGTNRIFVIERLLFGKLKAYPWKDQFRVNAHFNLPLEIENLSRFVGCEPKVDFSLQARDRDYDGIAGESITGIRITGDFQPGKTYTFTFRKGLESKKGHRLAADVRQSITIPNREPSLDFAVQGRYLVPGGELLLPVKTIGITKLKTTVAKIPAHNIVQLAARDSNLYDNFSGRSENNSTLDIALEPKVRTSTLNADVNRIVQSQLNLRDFIAADTQATDASGKGVFLVKIERDNERSNDDGSRDSWYSSDDNAKFRLVCVSDIGLSAQYSGDSLLVWATSLKAGTPLPGAKLKLYNLNNTVAAEGETNADGLLTLPFPQQEKDPFLLVATAGDGTDTTFLPLTKTHSVRDTETPERAFLKPGESEAFVFSDRGIYRHEDPVFVQAILRNNEGRAPAPFPLVLDVLKPDGKLFKTLPLMPDETGAASPAAPITLGEDQPSGRWTLRLKTPGADTELGSQTISVESFVPPQIRVAVRDIGRGIHPDDGVHFTLFAEHLFGRPAANLQAGATVVFTESAFTPNGWKNYHFGDTNHKPASQTVKVREGSLDENGLATFSASPPKPLSPSHAVRVMVSGNVIELGGRQVSAWGSFWLHNASVYPGVRAAGDALATPGAPFNILLAAVQPDGTRSKGHEATVVVHSISHISNFIYNDGHYEWHTERVRTPLKTTKIEFLQDADTPFSFTPPDSGSYELEITASDFGATTVFPFYAGTDADQARGRGLASGGDALNITFDKDSYNPGDTVRGNLGSPVSGLALITVRGVNTTRAFLRPIGADGGTFEFPVGEDAFPGVDVSVALVRPAIAEAEWRAHRFYGSKALSVRRPAARLDIKTQSTVAITNGGSTVDVAVHAATHDGKPAAGAIATVLLTDEAIHILTNESLPVPADFFEVLRRVPLTAYDMFNRLIPLVKAENVLSTDAAPGGDASSSLLNRINPVKSRRFKPLSQWSTDALVGADGIARAKFNLPEFSGEVRVTAVVRSKEATGSTKEQVKIKPRIVAKADGPRFLAPGDTAQILLAIYNESGAAGEITVAASIKNGTGKLDTTRLQLAAGASGNVSVAVTAPEKIGHTTITFLVSGAGETHTSEIEFPVRPAAPWETAYQYVPVAAGKTATFTTPATLNAALAKQSFHVTPNSGVELLPALKFLTHYPYGCVEQTTSSVFPLIAAYGEAGDLLAADPEFNNQSKRFLEAAVQRLSLMLRDDGFSYWPGSTWIEKRYSLYAAHFVVEATHSGAVSADSLKKTTLEILEKIQRRGEFPEKAYASHILAIAGKAERNTLLALSDMSGQLDRESLCHLSLAFALSGDNAHARSLIEQVAQAERKNSSKENYEPLSVVELSFAVLAQLEADPTSPRVAEWLARLRKHTTNNFHWGTTWDNAHALLAFTANVRRNGGLATKATFAIEDSAKPTPAETFADSKGHVFHADGTSTVSITNQGRSPLYVFQSVLSVPLAKPEKAASNGVFVERRFYDLEGKEIALNSLAQGDTVVVGLELKFPSSAAITEQMVVEDLLPACLEVDASSFLRNGDLLWLPKHDVSWVLHREVRDDRVLLFSQMPNRENRIYYKAQVVSKGSYALPPVAAEAMYEPAVNARSAGGKIQVK